MATPAAQPYGPNGRLALHGDWQHSARAAKALDVSRPEIHRDSVPDGLCMSPTRGDSPADSLHRLAYERCIPVSVVIELTRRCNLSCLHCYNFDRTQPYPRQVQELTSAEFGRVVDEVCAEGCLYLSFSGGEPLAYRPLDELVRRARAHHARVRIKTNGAMLSERRAAELHEAGVDGFDISLYGGSPAVHDAFTLRPGSFAATLAGLANARRIGAAVRLNICVTRHNAAEVAEMRAIADAHDCDVGLDTMITSRQGGDPGPHDLRVDRETLEALYRGPMADLLLEPDFDPGRSVQCNCARSMAGISSLGDVYPCIGAPIACGNIREASFAHIWWTSPVLQRIRGLTLEEFVTCAPCPLRPHCSRSSGAVWMSTGNYTGAEEWTCMDADVRRAVYESRTVAPHTSHELGAE